MASDSRSAKRAARIRSEVPMVRVLASLGYHVNPEGSDHEQQFSCDLHGDGRDTKKSARYYPSSNSIYCWACGRARDAITLIREKKGVSFQEALTWLEHQYGLPTLPWEPADSGGGRAATEIVTGRSESAEAALHRLDRAIASSKHDGSVPLADIARFWEAHDKIAYMRSSNEDPKVIEVVMNVLSKLSELTSIGDGHC